MVDYTVDREIFVVKKFLSMTSTTKIKQAKYFVRRIIRVSYSHVYVRVNEYSIQC